MNLRKMRLISAVALAAAMATGPAMAQQRPAEQWYVEKTKGGVFKAPMRPLWKLSELKKMHAGQDNWSQVVVKDGLQEATYNSGKPGFQISRRMHSDTPTLFVVVSGEMKFEMEGQAPITATRGSIVNIPRTTIYSGQVSGTGDALWVEINPDGYATIYPASEPAPAARAGGQVTRVAFNHAPLAFRAPNLPHWNLFAALAACEPRGNRVLWDNAFATPVINYANPADDKCPRQAGGGGGAPMPAGPFNPRSTFGHVHPGLAEWWIVQVGHIDAKFENAGEFHAEEGDVLYAPPMTWHQMGVEGPGVSVRLALGGYNIVNMNNTAGQVGAGDH